MAEELRLQGLLALELGDEPDRLEYRGVFGRFYVLPLLAAGCGVFFEGGELCHCTGACPPPRTADVAELGAAPTRHVLACLAVLDVRVAPVAALPPFLLG